MFAELETVSFEHMEVIRGLFGSIIGSGIISGIFLHLWKKFISSKYDKDLEFLKTSYANLLNQQNIRFSWWHQEQAKAIVNLFSSLSDLQLSLDSLTAPMKPYFSEENEEGKRNYYKPLFDDVCVKYKIALDYWFRNRIFFNFKNKTGNIDINQTLDGIFYKCREISQTYDVAVLSGDFERYHEATEQFKNFEKQIAEILDIFTQIIKADDLSFPKREF